ncbi:MAG: hypothetical protein ACE147_03040 [Candidatus Methylomirabilales bacterium]
MADRETDRPALDEAAILRAVRAQRAGWKGLCRDCVKADTCTYPRDPARPVWGCDEYVSFDPLNPSHQPPPLVPGVVPAEVAPLAELRGLCRTCAHAASCTYPKPPGGVWQCEELE